MDSEIDCIKWFNSFRGVRISYVGTREKYQGSYQVDAKNLKGKPKKMMMNL